MFKFFSVEGLIDALGKFCTSPVVLWRKMQLTLYLKLSYKVWFACRPFRRDKSIEVSGLLGNL